MSQKLHSLDPHSPREAESSLFEIVSLTRGKNAGIVGIVSVVASCMFLLLITLHLPGCGDTEHVPSPFEVSPDEMAREKIFVAASGPSSSDPGRNVGLVTVITHGGRDDLKTTSPIETALLGDVAVTTGGYVYISNPEAGSVTILSAATDMIEGIARVGIRPGNVAVDPLGQFVFVTNHGASGDTRPDSISVIDANPTTTTFLQEVAQAQVEDGANDLVFSTRRDRAFVSNRLAGTVSVIDIDPANIGTFLATTMSIQVGPSPGVMTYSSHSGHVYVVLSVPTANESIAVIDADSLGAPKRVPGIPRGMAMGELPQASFLQANRNGTLIWATFSNQTSGGGIGVIDTTSNTVISRLDLSGFTPHRLVEANNATVFLSGGEGMDEIVVVNASFPRSLREVTRISVGTAGAGRGLTLSRDRTRVYVLNSNEETGSVSVIDVNTTSVIATLAIDGANNLSAIASIDAIGLEVPLEDEFGGHGHDPAHHSP